MRVRLDTGGMISQDANRGIGVYAWEMTKRLPKQVTVVEGGQELTHYLVFKTFLPRKMLPPAVVTVHDLIPLKYPQAYPPGIRGRLKWWRQKQQLKKIDGIITDSQASKQDIMYSTGINGNKVHVIYLAAAEVFQPQKVVNRFGLPQKFVLYVGDLNWNKNVVFLTKICLSLDFPLVVVGRQAAEESVPFHQETQELIKFLRLAKKHSKKIIRLGTVSNEDLVSIYNLATVYIQPSRDEGFGLPVLEAMSCGCPVLSSGKGSLPEITGKAALAFTRRNLELVWNNPSKRQELIAAGAKQAHKFSWNKTIKETVKVYEKIIADRANH